MIEFKYEVVDLLLQKTSVQFCNIDVTNKKLSFDTPISSKRFPGETFCEPWVHTFGTRVPVFDLYKNRNSKHRKCGTFSELYITRL